MIAILKVFRRITKRRFACGFENHIAFVVTTALTFR